MALQHQLDQLQADRDLVDGRSRDPWWSHVVTGAAVGASVLVAFAAAPSLAAVGGALTASVIGVVTTWRDARSGLSRGRRFGARRVWPMLAWGVVSAVVLVGGAVVVFTTPADRDPWVRLGLSAVAGVLVGVAGAIADRWAEARDVVRSDMAPLHVPELDDPLRLRLVAVLAAADARLDALGELLGLDATQLEIHLTALASAGLITREERRSVVTGDATWVEITDSARTALGRHLAELRRRTSPTFHA